MPLAKMKTLLETKKINNIIIIPMKMNKLDEYMKKYHTAGFNPILLSEGNLQSKQKNKKTNCLIVDTFGVSEHIYSVPSSCLTIIGGGFSETGSHSPMEPMKHGCYTIVGKNIADHKDSVELGESLY
jgi:3-deoxy-D-manno-octulosonic-acid transferase